MRSKPIWQNANLWTLAHLITMPFAMFFIIKDLWWWMLGSIIASLICDVGDGLVARRFKTESSYGRKFDPAVDATVRSSIFLGMVYAGVFDGAWCFIVIVFPLRDILVSFSRQMGWNDGARTSGKAKAIVQTISQLGIGLGMAFAIPHVRDINLALLILAGFVTLWSCHDYMPWRKLGEAIMATKHTALHVTYIVLWGAFSTTLLLQLWWPSFGVGLLLFAIYSIYRHTQHPSTFGRRFNVLIPLIMGSLSFLMLALNKTITSYDAALTLIPVLVVFLISFNRQVKTETKAAEGNLISFGWATILLLTSLALFFAWNPSPAITTMITTTIAGLAVLTAYRCTRWSIHRDYIMRRAELPA